MWIPCNSVHCNVGGVSYIFIVFIDRGVNARRAPGPRAVCFDGELRRSPLAKSTIQPAPLFILQTCLLPTFYLIEACFRHLSDEIR